ncbi:CYTH domain-containing protein [Paenarthrobacter nicotinovorans]|uniref:CYTH domain-containing protein n=1 Tax=Paenarthrobacter nicotinovorans TaxID=29320 RepID=UPI003D673E2B
MTIEYERKYVVAADGWQHLIESSIEITQGYIASDANAEIRVRQHEGGSVVTIKSLQAVDEIGRLEYEYAVPESDASEMLEHLATNLLRKTRFVLAYGPGRWTIDLFHGENSGLILLEVESDNSFTLEKLPTWVQAETTHDPRYKNSYLAKNPYTTWS